MSKNGLTSEDYSREGCPSCLAALCGTSVEAWAHVGGHVAAWVTSEKKKGYLLSTCCTCLQDLNMIVSCLHTWNSNTYLTNSAPVHGVHILTWPQLHQTLVSLSYLTMVGTVSYWSIDMLRHYLKEGCVRFGYKTCQIWERIGLKLSIINREIGHVIALY